jgi:hypothetical protein
MPSLGVVNNPKGINQYSKGGKRSGLKQPKSSTVLLQPGESVKVVEEHLTPFSKLGKRAPKTTTNELDLLRPGEKVVVRLDNGDVDVYVPKKTRRK